MTIILPALGVAFAAFCVWLTVRFINRRERWAKWTAVWLAIAMVLYPLSLGPCNWLAERGYMSSKVAEIIEYAYLPIIVSMEYGPDWVKPLVFWYVELWGR